MPERIQLSRKKGWRMPPNTVKVSRPGRWGNPFRIGSTAHQLAAVHRVAQPMSITDRASLALTQLAWLFAAAIGWRPMV